MKKYLFILLAALTFVACSDDDYENYSLEIVDRWLKPGLLLYEILEFNENGQFVWRNMERQTEDAEGKETHRMEGEWTMHKDGLILMESKTSQTRSFRCRIGYRYQSQIGCNIKDTLFLYENRNDKQGCDTIVFEKYYEIFF